MVVRTLHGFLEGRVGANPQGIKSCETTFKGINNPEKLKSNLGDSLEPLNTKKHEP